MIDATHVAWPVATAAAANPTLPAAPPPPPVSRAVNRTSGSPSHYVRAQCHVTLGADRAPLLTRSITGIEPLMWASDYPHPEGTYPHSQATVARIFADLSADERHAVTFANAARLYDFDPVVLTGALA